MSLLKEIQNDAINQSVDVSVVLRKCKILAARLGNEEFKSWVESELNGYKSGEQLPDYRILKVQSYGNFVGFGGRSADGVPIAPSSIPPKYRESVTTQYSMNPISYFDSLLREKGAEGETLQSPWAADLIRLCGRDIYETMNCISAWRLIPSAAIAALLDSVRNRILGFALEIEAEAPDAGDALPGTRPIPEDRVSQMFQTNVLGNVGNLSTGIQSISHSQINVVQNDLESLRAYLKSLWIDQLDLTKLDEAMDEDAKSGGKAGVGTNVGTWIGKMISKAASGTWNMATTVAANILTKAILRYYGLE